MESERTAELSAAAEVREAAQRAAELGQAACVEQGAGVGPGSAESGPPAVMWSAAELSAGPAVGPQPWSVVT